MKTGTKVAGLLLMLVCGMAQADWVQFASSNGGQIAWAYDPTRVASLPDGNIKVWYQTTQSAYSKIADMEAEAVDAEKTIGKEVAGLMRAKIPRYRNFSHTLHRSVFDCRQQKFFDEESIDYSLDGEVLDRRNMNSSVAEMESMGFRVNSNRFSEIPPGSLIELLMKRICK